MGLLEGLIALEHSEKRVLERIGLLEGEMGSTVLRVDTMKLVSRAKRLVSGGNKHTGLWRQTNRHMNMKSMFCF